MYFYPFLVHYHVLVLTLAFEQPFLEVLCAQRIGVLLVAGDFVALGKRVGRIDDDQLVAFHILLGTQTILEGIYIFFTVEEHIVGVARDMVPALRIVLIRQQAGRLVVACYQIDGNIPVGWCTKCYINMISRLEFIRLASIFSEYFPLQFCLCLSNLASPSPYLGFEQQPLPLALATVFSQ